MEEPLQSHSWLARAGMRIFGCRLGVGLLALIPAALLVRPRLWNVLPLGLKIAGLAGVILGLFLRAWAAAHAGAHTRSGVIEAPHLACSGPYARVRNPIYLGNFILGLGMVALLGDARLLPLHASTFVVLYATIIPAEERLFFSTFGKAYRHYCTHVPRLLPRIRSWPGGSANPPEWRNAIGELRIAGLLAIIYVVLTRIGGSVD